jgi:hypothetical protein
MEVDHGDALGPQPLGVLLLEPGHEPSLGVDDTPPRNGFVGHPQVVADRPGRARKPGLLRHLAVGHDLAGYQTAEHRKHPSLERPHKRSLHVRRA